MRRNIAAKDPKRRSAKSRKLSVEDIDWEARVARTRKRKPERWIAKDLGLPKSLLHVLEEDDWSLVVKVHGYIEAAINELLTVHFNDPRVNDIIHRMNIGHDKRGKLGLIKALDMLPSEAVGFVKSLCDLRNTFAHSVKWLDVDLKKHLQDKNFKAQWKNVLNWWCSDRSEENDSIVFLFPRNAIVTAASMVMHTAADWKYKAREKQARTEAMTAMGELVYLRKKKRKLLKAIAKESPKRHQPKVRKS